MFTRYNIPFGSNTLTLETVDHGTDPTGVHLTLGSAAALGRCYVTPRQGNAPVSVSVSGLQSATRMNESADEAASTISSLVQAAVRSLVLPDCPHALRMDVQILKADEEIDRELLAILTAATVLRLSGLPLQGGLGAVRVLLDGTSFMLNPKPRERELANGSVLVVGSELGVLALEARGTSLENLELLDGIVYAQQKLQVFIEAVDHFVEKANVPQMVWCHEKRDIAFEERVAIAVQEEVQKFLDAASEFSTLADLPACKERWGREIAPRFSPRYSSGQIRDAVERYVASALRHYLLSSAGAGRSISSSSRKHKARGADRGSVRTDLGYVALGPKMGVIDNPSPEERDVCDMVCRIDGTEGGVSLFSVRVRTQGVSLTFLQMALHRAHKTREAALRPMEASI